MISRASKYILFVFFLIVAVGLKFIALAEEALTDGVMVRPVMEYASGKLRDPFRSYLRKEESKQSVAQAELDLTKPELDLSKLKVQGIIWGVKTPQAIINDKVWVIGDLIEGAKIISIEKKVVSLGFNGEIFDLTLPGESLALAETNKEE